jgi:probable H4MPT-linked C1 transfer pathway protein
MHVVGLDIGGANLKAADTDGQAVSLDFPMWKNVADLSGALIELLQRFDSPELIAVTMTAELADCFVTKSEGVDRILAAVERAANSVPIVVWQTGAEFVEPQVARQIPLLVAAANWHALTTFAGRLVPESDSLLIDIGTTTTDLIPLQEGVPIPVGLTDVERLQSGELVYSGIWRTPLCALAQSVPLRSGRCSLAAELFATTLDIYLILEDIPDQPECISTADGRPATRAAAVNRLCRMLCCDSSELTPDEVHALADHFAELQIQQMLTDLDQVVANQAGPCQAVIISGSGSFLARKLIAQNEHTRDVRIVDFNNAMSVGFSESACAYAVARLAAERIVC